MQQAVCVQKKKIEKKNTEKSAPPKTHHEIHSSPVTATTSRRRATKHVPRDSPYSPASIDPGFVEIDRVQLSRSLRIEREMRQAGLILAAGRVRSKKKNEKKNEKKTKSRRTQNTPA